MSFELYYVVPPDRTPPDPARMEAIISKLPHVEKQETQGAGLFWHYEYLNPETGVVCSFRCKPAEAEVAMFKGYKDTGLSYAIPYLCPTFFSREALPLAEQVGKPLNMSVVNPSGQVMDADAGLLQHVWQEGNRKSLEVVANTTGNSPPYFPREKLDEMWRYMMARHQMDTRYTAKGIYVPRVLLIRNKLNRNQVFMAAMWTELSPAVIPDVEAFVIGKPKKALFGLLSTGEVEPVVVRAEGVMKVLEPHLRHVDRPIPHRLLEEVGKVRGAIFKEMGKILTPNFSTFETIGVEEVVDIEE